MPTNSGALPASPATRLHARFKPVLNNLLDASLSILGLLECVTSCTQGEGESGSRVSADQLATQDWEMADVMCLLGLSRCLPPQSLKSYLLPLCQLPPTTVNSLILCRHSLRGQSDCGNRSELCLDSVLLQVKNEQGWL